MDAILKSTIRVTKCLLSYGVVQENVEKIILEAFADEIVRYPVLYERNLYEENSWTKYKNCLNCKIVITEIASKCDNCRETICRFCLKDKCCPSCLKSLDKKCVVCGDMPSIPVSCRLEQCKCNNIYCLNCLYNPTSMVLNLQECVNCKVPFRQFIPGHVQLYSVLTRTLTFLDSKYGEIYCPRKCGEKMLRSHFQSHLEVCPNAKKRYE